MHTILRLCRRRIEFQNKRFLRLVAANSDEHTPTTKKPHEELDKKPPEKDDFNDLLLKYKDKITFSSYLDHEKLRLGYFKYYLNTVKEAKRSQAKEFQDRSLTPLPVSLMYCVEKHRLLAEDAERPLAPAEEPAFQQPLAGATRVPHTQQDHAAPNPFGNASDATNGPAREQASATPPVERPNTSKWMTNYEYFDDSKLPAEEDGEESEDEGEWSKQYGTPDPSAAVSRVPCGGCGALLHCSDPAIPGYLPSEIFKGRHDEELQTMDCQRCHFLKEYNIALDVTVHPDEYEKLLQSIRHVKALVLLMVDLLDFPCSIWPGIMDIIGTERPIIIVGNKVDLIPGDSHGYLKRIELSLLNEISKTRLAEANIKHVALISAKTGYGVEGLVSAMFKHWLYKGDVFLVGCTNVGKSSLFNALLHSDYCKAHAADAVRRATVSRWPGTTLNLLKFPINRPSGWKIYQRTRRLASEARMLKAEREIRRGQLLGRAPAEPPALIGHIGRTFVDTTKYQEIFAGDQPSLKTLKDNEHQFPQSKWLYDTPGVIHPEQVLSLLSTEELLLAVPKRLIRPQTFYLQPGYSILVGGLARLDHVACAQAEAARFTVFCAEGLPLTVARTEDAAAVYAAFVGTPLLGVPSGGPARLRRWAGLRAHEPALAFDGEGPRRCCGDVVLGAAGWASVAAGRGARCLVRAWTPHARGVHRRQPALLPHAVQLKGKRLRDTPAYMPGRAIFADDD